MRGAIMSRNEMELSKFSRRTFLVFLSTIAKKLLIFIAYFNRLGMDVIAGYIALDPETQARNISAWTGVVAEVLQGFCTLEDRPVRLDHV
jgi:hypothetical protein